MLSCRGFSDENAGNLLLGHFFESDNHVVALGGMTGLQFFDLDLKVAAL